MLLCAVDWDVNEEETSRIRGRGDFGCVWADVDAVYGLDSVCARLGNGYWEDGVFSDRGDCFWHRGEAYAIEVAMVVLREWFGRLRKEITKSKILILSVSCAKSNAVNYPKAGILIFYLFIVCPMLTAL